MNKRYFPAIAALLIAVTCTSFLPALAQVASCPNGSGLPCLPTFLAAEPVLTVITIAQDDQLRNTGVIWLADTMANYVAGTPAAQDLMAQFKLFVSYNGLPIAPTSIFCQFVEKDKSEPIKNAQGPWETLVSVPKDVSQNFICKPRWAAPGVGVLDVYYIGPGLPVSIADYVLVVTANFAIGRTLVYGTDMQDICVLGWPVSSTADSTTEPTFYQITKPNGGILYLIADPLGGWKSCEDLALAQHADLGVPIEWT